MAEIYELAGEKIQDYQDYASLNKEEKPTSLHNAVVISLIQQHNNYLNNTIRFNFSNCDCDW